MKKEVAPLVGAWIETNNCKIVVDGITKSHPSWVRGLKHPRIYGLVVLSSRTPRGCVD